MSGVSMNQISVQHIKSKYGKKQVLTDVNLEIEKGQCVGILGANGCGKSTLLSVLAGVRRPDGGSIFFQGKEMTGKQGQKVWKSFAGYVPQEDFLLPELTVWDNLLLFYTDRDILRRELEEGFLGVLGLRQMCRIKVSHLSGGMKKRASIGCALAGKPPVLILDEPGAALDIPGKLEIRRYLKLYKETGGTVILATHEESDLDLCDQLYVLGNGKCRRIDITVRGEELNKLLLFP